MRTRKAPEVGTAAPWDVGGQEAEGQVKTAAMSTTRTPQPRQMIMMSPSGPVLRGLRKECATPGVTDAFWGNPER
ncbi:hypothetical protein GCM10028793_46670 [Nocardiopsis oceani]